MVKNQITIILLLLTTGIMAQLKKVSVDHFNKVIISPHVQVTFIEGDTESVQIESSTVAIEKINIEDLAKP